MQYATQAKQALTSATVFCGNIADALTSRPAMRFYTKVWKYAVLSIQATFAIALLIGYAAFTLGYGFRDAVEAHNSAIDAFVQRHIMPTVEVQAVLMPAVESAAPDFEDDVWSMPVEALRTLITPAPVMMFQMLPALPPAKIEATVEPQKVSKRRGRKSRK